MKTKSKKLKTNEEIIKLIDKALVEIIFDDPKWYDIVVFLKTIQEQLGHEQEEGEEDLAQRVIEAFAKSK